MNIREKAKMHAVYQHSDYDDVFVVESGTSGNLYKVQPYTKGVYFCSCPWGIENAARPCSHTVAVQNHVNRKRVVDSLSEPEAPASKVKSIVVRPDGSIEVTYNL